MALLVFSILALFVGNDIRQHGLAVSRAYVFDGGAHFTGQDAIAIGAWTSILGGACLNAAVWQLF